MNKGIEAILLAAQDTADQCFAERGEVTPMTVIAGNKNPQTGAKEQGIIVASCPFDGPGSKEAFAEAIRKMAKECDAFAVCLIVEAWIRTQGPDDPIPENLADEEGAKECAFILLETAEGTRQFQADIVRGGNSKNGMLSPWVELPKADTGGKFANFLPGTGNKAN